MIDQRFHKSAGPYTLGHLAQISESTLAQGVDPEQLVHNVAPLELAGPKQISFLHNAAYVDAFEKTQAGACVINPEMADKYTSNAALLISSNPHRSYALIAAAFYPEQTFEPGVHAAAVVHVSVQMGAGCYVGPGAVIEEGVKLGKACYIAPNAVVHSYVELGDGVQVGSNATLTHCLIGNHVVIHPGACIGRPGFGFAPGGNRPVKIPQLGRVIIEDYVEVGANTCIDRGSIADTVVRSGTMIDNLVQIGHNVEVGEACIVVSQVGISGSTKIGKAVQIGGQAGLVGHIKVGDGARIAAKSGVMKNVESQSVLCGIPAEPMLEFGRKMTALKRLVRK